MSSVLSNIKRTVDKILGSGDVYDRDKIFGAALAQEIKDDLSIADNLNVDDLLVFCRHLPQVLETYTWRSIELDCTDNPFYRKVATWRVLENLKGIKLRLENKLTESRHQLNLLGENLGSCRKIRDPLGYLNKGLRLRVVIGVLEVQVSGVSELSGLFEVEAYSKTVTQALNRSFLEVELHTKTFRLVFENSECSKEAFALAASAVVYETWECLDQELRPLLKVL